MFVPYKGADCFFIILIPGFTRAQPKNKKKTSLCPFLIAGISNKVSCTNM